MSQDDFERAVLALWMTTRVPLTRANLLYITGAPRKKLDAWLKEMVLEGVLEPDVDENATEMVWSVRGAVRPVDGPTSIAELDKLTRLGREAQAPRASGGVGVAASAAQAATALVLRREAGTGRGALVPAGDKDKSLLASGLLGLVFGPLGWLYAGHWREAAPSAAGYLLAYVVLPGFLFMPIATIVHPVSALIALGYAWKYNRSGERQKLLPDEPKGK